MKLIHLLVVFLIFASVVTAQGIEIDECHGSMCPHSSSYPSQIPPGPKPKPKPHPQPPVFYQEQKKHLNRNHEKNW